MKVLPLYTSTGQRDAERVNSWSGLLSPTWKFLPWQIQRDHIADTYLESIFLVDCEGNETDVYGYFHGTEVLLTGFTNGTSPGSDYDSFVTSGTAISVAISTGTDFAACDSNEFVLATGNSVDIRYDLTLNSGTLPNIHLGSSGGALYSSKTLAAAGGDLIHLIATGNNSGSVAIIVENLAGNDTNFAVTFSDVNRPVIKLTEKTTYDFITYNGSPLSTTLPYGVHYLKVADEDTTWYSEWFSVRNIQPQILTGYAVEDYDTFTSSGANITSAIHASGSASARTNSFSIHTGEKFIYTYDLTLNSGDLPSVRLAVSNVVGSNSEELVAGLHELELTAIKSGTGDLRIVTTDATNYSVSSVSLRRKAGDYVYMEYTNTNDIQGQESIFYASGFTQQVYLDTSMTPPAHEMIETGEEKNGVFQAEKMVDKLVYSLVAYESWSLFRALRILPLHDDIEIIDRTGKVYTPQQGNVRVAVDWGTFDTGSLRIDWNELGDVWTSNMDNIT